MTNQMGQGMMNSPLTNTPTDTGIKTYNTGLYVRLSVEDGGLSKESESLIHQEQFLLQFLEERPELILKKVYRDNGETGTNFDRPGFNDMMADLRKGVINCIVVKDPSRFGRDYIQTGEYMEKIFPFMGTRFISVLENFDNSRPDAMDMLMVNLKNLMNEAYAKDKSKRICSAFDAKRANGEYNVKYAPYGYRISGDKARPYAIDPEPARIVREIFSLRQGGMSITGIARYLDEKGYETPNRYAVTNAIRKKERGSEHWNIGTIFHILHNPAYIGTMQLRKTETRLYQGMKRRTVAEEDQFIVENVNEPIISKEQFDAVQNMTESRSFPKRKSTAKSENVFVGLIFCAECGRPLYRSRSKSAKGKTVFYYSCPTYRDYHGKYCPHKGGMREEEIRELVLAAVKGQAKTASKIEMRAASLTQPAGNDVQSVKALKDEIKRLENLSREAFERYLLEEISEADYLAEKARFDREIRQLTEQTEKAESKAGKSIADNVRTNPHIKQMKSFTRARAVTREMCESLIERIEVDKDHNLTVALKWKDEFAALMKEIKRTEETGNVE